MEDTLRLFKINISKILVKLIGLYFIIGNTIALGLVVSGKAPLPPSTKTGFLIAFFIGIVMGILLVQCKELGRKMVLGYLFISAGIALFFFIFTTVSLPISKDALHRMVWRMLPMVLVIVALCFFLTRRKVKALFTELKKEESIEPAKIEQEDLSLKKTPVLSWFKITKRILITISLLTGLILLYIRNHHSNKPDDQNPLHTISKIKTYSENESGKPVRLKKMVATQNESVLARKIRKLSQKIQATLKIPLKQKRNLRMAIVELEDQGEIARSIDLGRFISELLIA